MVVSSTVRSTSDHVTLEYRQVPTPGPRSPLLCATMGLSAALVSIGSRTKSKEVIDSYRKGPGRQWGGRAPQGSADGFASRPAQEGRVGEA